MTVYKSELTSNGVLNRVSFAQCEKEYQGRVRIKAGTVLAIGDDLLGVPVAENQVITKVAVLVLGDLGAAEGSVGRFRILDENGSPVVVERKGPAGPADTKFTSPATSAAAYAAAQPLAGYQEDVQATPAKLAGPANVGIRVTTGGTAAVDTDVFIQVTLLGEVAAPGEFSGDDAYIYESRYPL